jgi:hypothetical protein
MIENGSFGHSCRMRVLNWAGPEDRCAPLKADLSRMHHCVEPRMAATCHACQLMRVLNWAGPEDRCAPLKDCGLRRCRVARLGISYRAEWLMRLSYLAETKLHLGMRRRPSTRTLPWCTLP